MIENVVSGSDGHTVKVKLLSIIENVVSGSDDHTVKVKLLRMLSDGQTITLCR